MRTITSHHDGHGLTESISIVADAAGPGGASHNYSIYLNHGKGTPQVIQYQKGPRNEPASTPGILDSVLLAIVADRMEAFQAGPFASRENALVLTKVQEALHWLRHRADDRAARSVLGTNQK